MGFPSASDLFIVTGAPGSGKTVILSRLSSAFRCVNEPARKVLAEQRATGGTGTWDPDPFLFVHLLLQRSIEKYETARKSGDTAIFDRASLIASSTPPEPGPIQRRACSRR